MPSTLTPAGRRILDAASRLFYEQGITGVGVELIAEQAGTTKKTLYDRFGSKDGLVVAYLEARLERWQRHVTDHLDASGASGTDRVLAVLDASESWVAQGSRGCGFVNAYAELSHRSPRATAIIRAQLEWIRDLYARLLREADHPGGAALARRLALVQEGAIIAGTAGGSAAAYDDAREAARHLLR